MLDSNENNFYKRIKIIFAFIFVLLCVLIYNLYVIQIRFSEKYSMLSDKNRIRVSPIMPKRGKIISSDKKVIAYCNRKYKLVLEACDEKTFLKNLTLISSCIKISDEEKEQFLRIRKSSPRYTPIVIKDNLSWDEYAKIALILFKLNHVSIETSFTRVYENPYEFSHIVGHTSGYDGHLRILSGKTGIESFFENELRGEIGILQTEINAAGRKMRVIESSDPIEGKDIILTINSNIQKYAYNLIAEEKAGACVVLDITNGNVIALVSVPGFDANLLSSKMSQKQWNEIANDKLSPLINRATSGLYPPGSIFKTVVAFAALSEGMINPNERFFCNGEMKIDNHVFHCVRRSGHGSIDLYDAIRMSCDCYFFELARKLGIEKIAEYARKLGFGSKTGLEIPSENSGLVPDKTWKLLKYQDSWKPYETVLVGIGQGSILSTVLQNAVMFGKIYANDYGFKPTLIKKYNVQNVELPKDPILGKGIFILKEALFQVCNKIGGTAERSCHTQYGISGKTGSSQVRRVKAHEIGLINQESIPWKYRDHAFFVGCAPKKNPKYVVAVLVEHGGWGAQKAAPIARKIFDKLMELENYGTL